jgi:D-sedoheptulose 7-phosphate isomerase
MPGNMHRAIASSANGHRPEPARYRESNAATDENSNLSNASVEGSPVEPPIPTMCILRQNMQSSIETHVRFLEACLPAVAQAATALIAAYLAGRKAIFFGNGGSAADAQHLAAEFLGRYLQERAPLPALALNANTSAVTAIGNDYGYEQTFSRQLRALSAPGDVAVGISTSGNSANVFQALICARELGLFTIALTGASGGKLRGRVDVLIAVPSDDTPRIQECHILAGHAICDTVERAVVANS